MQYLIDFFNTVSDTDINQYMTDNGCTVLKTWSNFDKVYLVETDNVPPATSIVERVIEENAVAMTPHNVTEFDPYYGCHTNPNYPAITVDIDDKKDWWKNYSYSQPKFENGPLEIRRLGQGIDVYVVDSGINELHPEFENTNIVKLWSVTPGDFSDRSGHGTAIASIISGKTCGITEATIKVVKIFDATHPTLQSEFLDALDTILNDHEENTYGILNASWSIPKNEWVEHKLRVCIENGIFVIAAAGNTGTPIDDVTPASMMEAITIGSYNMDLVPSSFSDYTGSVYTAQDGTNHGELDGWSPGEDIWCAGIQGYDYDWAGGTSMAAATASAILAANLTWRVNPDGTRKFQFENLIVSTLSNNTIHGLTVLFARGDLLDLSDPKYANSTNVITTIRDYCNMRGPGDPSDEITLLTRVNTDRTTILVNKNIVKKITFLDPLPPNFEVTDVGGLWARPTADQGPQGDEHYVKHSLRFVRTNINDEEEQCTLDLYILAEDKDISTIPEDDPIIPITLLIDCTQGGVSSGCAQGTAYQCGDNCFVVGATCCAGYKDSFLRCRCETGFR